jgi:hypothetical protein
VGVYTACLAHAVVYPLHVKICTLVREIFCCFRSGCCLDLSFFP